MLRNPAGTGLEPGTCEKLLIAEYNICAVAGIMWVEKSYTLYKVMEEYVGKEKADKGFPVKDFLKDDMAEVENAKCLATFVDGVQVYKA